MSKKHPARNSIRDRDLRNWFSRLAFGIIGDQFVEKIEQKTFTCEYDKHKNTFLLHHIATTALGNSNAAKLLGRDSLIDEKDCELEMRRDKWIPCISNARALGKTILAVAFLLNCALKNRCKVSAVEVINNKTIQLQFTNKISRQVFCDSLKINKSLIESPENKKSNEFWLRIGGTEKIATEAYKDRKLVTEAIDKLLPKLPKMTRRNEHKETNIKINMDFGLLLRSARGHGEKGEFAKTLAILRDAEKLKIHPYGKNVLLALEYVACYLEMARKYKGAHAAQYYHKAIKWGEHALVSLWKGAYSAKATIEEKELQQLQNLANSPLFQQNTLSAELKKHSSNYNKLDYALTNLDKLSTEQYLLYGLIQAYEKLLTICANAQDHKSDAGNISKYFAKIVQCYGEMPGNEQSIRKKYGERNPFENTFLQKAAESRMRSASTYAYFLITQSSPGKAIITCEESQTCLQNFRVQFPKDIFILQADFSAEMHVITARALLSINPLNAEEVMTHIRAAATFVPKIRSTIGIYNYGNILCFGLAKKPPCKRELLHQLNALITAIIEHTLSINYQEYIRKFVGLCGILTTTLIDELPHHYDAKKYQATFDYSDRILRVIAVLEQELKKKRRVITSSYLKQVKIYAHMWRGKSGFQLKPQQHKTWLQNFDKAIQLQKKAARNFNALADLCGELVASIESSLDYLFIQNKMYKEVFYYSKGILNIIATVEAETKSQRAAMPAAFKTYKISALMWEARALLELEPHKYTQSFKYFDQAYKLQKTHILKEHYALDMVTCFNKKIILLSRNNGATEKIVAAAEIIRALIAKYQLNDLPEALMKNLEGIDLLKKHGKEKVKIKIKTKEKILIETGKFFLNITSAVSQNKRAMAVSAFNQQKKYLKAHNITLANASPELAIVIVDSMVTLSKVLKNHKLTYLSLAHKTLNRLRNGPTKTELTEMINKVHLKIAKEYDEIIPTLTSAKAENIKLRVKSIRNKCVRELNRYALMKQPANNTESQNIRKSASLDY